MRAEMFVNNYPYSSLKYVIGNYIVDFYCHKAKLIIELDGGGHYEPEAQQKDMARTEYLESLGLKVLRFSNLEVKKYFREVCDKIHMVVCERT